MGRWRAAPEGQRRRGWTGRLLPIHGEVARSAGGAAPEGQRRRGSAERGGPGGAANKTQRLSRLELVPNRFHYDDDVAIDVSYRKPNDSQALGFQPCLAPLVVSGLFFGMTWTVNFDHQPCGGTIEVDVIRPDWLLASEFPSVQLSTS